MKKKLSIIILCTVIFSSCIQKAANKCPDFFSKNSKENILNQKIFAIKNNAGSNENCTYNLEFNSWHGITKDKVFYPEFSLTGLISWEKDKIILLPSENKNTIVYFDFDMKTNTSIPINYSFLSKTLTGEYSKIEKKYELQLNAKFYEPSYQDTLYHFCFKNYGYKYKGDNLHFIVGREVGIVGIFATFKKEAGECIYTNFGEVIFSKEEKSMFKCDDIL